jgi:hypothetical protein
VKLSACFQRIRPLPKCNTTPPEGGQRPYGYGEPSDRKAAISLRSEATENQGMKLVSLIAGFLLASAGAAFASGGNYVITGGNSYEQQQVRQALAASSFDWGVVPGPVQITIMPQPSSDAVPGQIFLDPAVLDSGEFSWGVVQHEYAHEVDFALLDDAKHAQIERALGGTAWCYEDSPTQLQHNEYGCERFASTLAWAYWQTPDNCMKPSAIAGESGGMAPAAFRALLSTLLGTPEPQTAQSTQPRFAPKVTAKRTPPTVRGVRNAKRV